MSTSAEPQVVHRAPGRVRVHWPQAFSESGPDVRQVLASIPGARVVRASALTANILVQFDERATTSDEVLAGIRRLAARSPRPGRDPRGDGRTRPSSPLRPPEPGSRAERPQREPAALELVESAARAAGAVAGLGLVLVRRRSAGPLRAAETAAAVASAVAVLEGFPELRAASGRLFGYRGRSALLGAAGVAANTLAGSPLGLSIAVLVSSRQLRESYERRRAFAAYRARSTVQDTGDGRWSARVDHPETVPATAAIVDGAGCAAERDGAVRFVGPGSELGAGTRLFGGPFVVELRRRGPDRGRERLPPSSDTWTGQWREAAALAVAAVVLLSTRSLSRAVGTLILLGVRSEILGREAADAWAGLRAIRSGALPLREDVALRRPNVVLFERAGIVSDGLEVADVEVLRPGLPASEAIELTLSVADLAGSPWGPISLDGRPLRQGEAAFDGEGAQAEIGGRLLALVPSAAGRGREGELRLVLSEGGDLLAEVSLRPRLGADAAEFAAMCRRHGIGLVLAQNGRATGSTRSLAEALRATLVRGSSREFLRRAAAQGHRVVLVTDVPGDDEALELADLTIGLADALNEPFAPPVDVLVPDLATAAAVLEATARRDLAVREARLVSSVANALGLVWISVRAPHHRLASTLANAATMTSLLVVWFRLRGGSPPRSTALRLVDPRPERWGRRATSDVLRALATSERGLSWHVAASRARLRALEGRQRHAFLSAVQAQLRSPLTGILVAGGALSLATSAIADVVLICGVIGLNAVLGAAQERQAGAAAEALEQMGRVGATVLRDGRRVRLPASELVPGDVLLLASGDRVGADARVLSSQGLEVDQASLTGESFPVAKRAEGGAPEARVVLDGTDVTVGSGRGVVFAVGRETRFGVTAAALATAPEAETVLERRLHRMLIEVLPIVVGGGVLVVLAGLIWRRPLATQLALGASTAIAAVPEGLPLLASVGEAAVARRLALRNALVRRLGAVESLGRVDVACVDKTGTLTENRLELQVVVGPTGARAKPERLTRPLQEVLLCAALASPSPDSSAARARGTDVAVVEGARRAGLASHLEDERAHEIPFDPSRGFYGTLVDGRLCVKGSPEEVAWRCTRVRLGDRDEGLDHDRRIDLLDLAHGLADEGLRVLMVGQGSAGTSLSDPDELVALGFLGIRDTIRASAAEAVRHCREAGIRLMVLTGDHPATARAIGQEIGLLDGGRVLTGFEIEELPDKELAAALEGTSVVARITPLEKLRIVEALRRRGHVVAMTGDGVNDAPALRLADVGIAMGSSGTEVARQAADLVLGDDDLTLLADTLIEGRTFWANLRVALAMLLGGNLGEVAFIVSLACAGFSAPLTARQVLAVNLVSDVLPAISLVVQAPKRRDLSRLAREGDARLGSRLRREIFVRAVSTATPALGAYLLARVVLGPQRAQSVGFASIVLTQLAQTLDAGREGSRTSLATTGAVGASVTLLAAALHLRPLQTFLGLTSPGRGWVLIAAAGAAAPAVSRALGENGAGRLALPAALRPRGV